MDPVHHKHHLFPIDTANDTGRLSTTKHTNLEGIANFCSQDITDVKKLPVTAVEGIFLLFRIDQN
jgi:hypothetical protein